MSYMDIENLYKNQEILEFKRIYSLEKIHGTSSHVSFKSCSGGQDNPPLQELSFFSGGASRDQFLALFDQEKLKAAFMQFFIEKVWEDTTLIVYGEAYGGKTQGMSETYGKELRFVAFEVKIGNSWLTVPAAESVARYLGFDFVPWHQIDGIINAVQEAMEQDSEQAVKNGMGAGHRREGVVLRPPIEVIKNNGGRIIAKHKNPEFSETKTQHPVDPEKMKVLADAQAIADEWVTGMRLDHVLDQFPQPWELKITGQVIKAMIEDIVKESKGEIVDSKEARTAVGTRTAKIFKQKVTQIVQ